MIKDRFKIGDIVKLRIYKEGEPHEGKIVNLHEFDKEGDCYYARNIKAMIVGYGCSKYLTFLDANNEYEDCAFAINKNETLHVIQEDDNKWDVVDHFDTTVLMEALHTDSIL